jgi:hypothetical protein
MPVGQEIPGKGAEPWISTLPGVVGHLDWNTGILHLTLLRYAMHESRLARRLSLVCHLLASESQVQKITFANGTAIREGIVDEIREKSDSLTQEITWEKRDLAMIDNLRFMHGRRAYEEGVPRDIVNVQTSRASFGYGATTRQRIKRA